MNTPGKRDEKNEGGSWNQMGVEGFISATSFPLIVSEVGGGEKGSGADESQEMAGACVKSVKALASTDSRLSQLLLPSLEGG
jgi:hypothetical protein